MSYNYVLTYQDFKNAQKLYRKHRDLAALSYYFWIWCLPIIGLFVAIPGILSMSDVGPYWFKSFEAFVFLGLWVGLFIPIWRIFCMRRLWKRLVPPNIKGSKMKAEIPVVLEFNDEQVINGIPGRSEGRFFWTAIPDFAEDDELALIFIQKKNFLFIPKRALPETAWAELRRLVATNVKAS